MSAASVRTHLAEVWALVDEVWSAFAGADATALPQGVCTHAERRLDAAIEGLRWHAVQAGRDTASAAQLTAALELGDQGAALVRSVIAAPGPAGPAPDHLDAVPDQLQALAAQDPEWPVVSGSLLLARVGLGGGGQRALDTARELLDTWRLRTSASPPQPATQQARATASLLQLASRAFGIYAPGLLPRLGPADACIVIADPKARLLDRDPTRSLVGVDTSALLATRAAGVWSVPGAPGPRLDRVVFHVSRDQIGPVRALTGDADAEAEVSGDQLQGRR